MLRRLETDQAETRAATGRDDSGDDVDAVVGGSFSQRAAEGDAVRMMNEPIEDGIAKRGVADEVVPVLNIGTWLVMSVARRPLRSSTSSRRSRRSRSPRGARPQSSRMTKSVFRELLQDAAVRAVTAGKRELAEQSWQAHIAHGVALATGGMTQRTG
jgi:hypothetical protein